MESKLQIHEDGGLRKVQNSRLVGIEKGFNLGITILFGHRMTMTQLDDEEVGTLVEYIMDQYPALFEAPDPPEDLAAKCANQEELLGDSLDRMKELKEVIKALVEAIEAQKRIQEAQTRPPATMVDQTNAQTNAALARGKEALD